MKKILTKENFWNRMEEDYPLAMVSLKTHIDSYKAGNNWDELFNYLMDKSLLMDIKPYVSSYPERPLSPKFHELPTAMQFGIFIEWYFLIRERIFPELGSNLPMASDPELCIIGCLRVLNTLFNR